MSDTANALPGLHGETRYAFDRDGGGATTAELAAAPLQTRQITIVAEIDLGPAVPNEAVLLAEERAADAPLCRLSLVPGTAGAPVLQAELWTDFSTTPLKVWAPLERIGEGRHQVVLRFCRTNLDLFVDGVLMDEEFPIGRYGAETPAQWVVDGAHVLRLQELAQALTDDQVVALAGGSDVVAANSNSYVGEWQAPDWGLQYWRPSGHNEYVADCQPVFADGRFHVYYQRGRRSHGNKWGLGAHEKGHVSSPDLRTWEMHPLALRISEEWEGSLATGCVFHDGNTYYMYYATRRPDRTQVVDMASSLDGITFEKLRPHPLAEPLPPYRVGPFRDPHVFRADGQFHMLVTAALEEPDVHNHGGTLAHLTSSDLLTWQQQPPFLTPGYRDHEPECPDHFEWNGRFYLVFSHHGVAHYRIADSAFGPWHTPVPDTLDGVFVRVMKTAPFHNGRRIGAAFLTPPGTFGGALLFREILQRADGTLATAFPAELTPRGSRVDAPAEPLTPAVEPVDEGLAMHGTQSIAAVAYRGVGRDLRVTARVTVAPGALAVGIVLGGSGSMQGGHELRLDLQRGVLSWRTGRMKSWETPDLAAIHLVGGLDRPLSFEVIRLGAVLDVCINGERTLATLQAPESGEDLFFYVHDGSATVADVTVEQLQEPGHGG